MDRDDPAYRGQSDYNELLLRLYDPLVLGPISRYVWRCPAELGVRLYRQHIRPNHLDVGPGTGYFLAHAGLPAGTRVTVLDPNPNVLRHVTRRLRDLEVTAVEADVLKPLPVTGPYDSAAMNAVLHCLPARSSARRWLWPTSPASSCPAQLSSAPRSSGDLPNTRGWVGRS